MALTMEFTGAETLNGAKDPALLGMLGAIAHFRAKHAYAFV